MKIKIVNQIADNPPCDVRIVRGREILADLSPDAYRGAGVTITPLYACGGYLCASAVTEDGVITQRAITQNAAYTFACGDTLETFSAGGTLSAIAVDTDALRPEVFRCLALRGVKVVFCVRLTPQPCPEDLVLFGPWSNAQANNLFVVDVGNAVTNVILPCALTDDQSGFLMRGQTDSASLDLPIERFYEGQRSFPVFQSLNRALFRSQLGRDPR